MKCFEWNSIYEPDDIQYAIFDHNNEFIFGITYNNKRVYYECYNYELIKNNPTWKQVIITESMMMELL